MRAGRGSHRGIRHLWRVQTSCKSRNDIAGNLSVEPLIKSHLCTLHPESRRTKRTSSKSLPAQCHNHQVGYRTSESSVAFVESVDTL